MAEMIAAMRTMIIMVRIVNRNGNGRMPSSSIARLKPELRRHGHDEVVESRLRFMFGSVQIGVSLAFQKGISSTVPSEFGGGCLRGLGFREFRLRDRFRE